MDSTTAYRFAESITALLGRIPASKDHGVGTARRELWRLSEKLWLFYAPDPDRPVEIRDLFSPVWTSAELLSELGAVPALNEVVTYPGARTLFRLNVHLMLLRLRDALVAADLHWAPDDSRRRYNYDINSLPIDKPPGEAPPEACRVWGKSALRERALLSCLLPQYLWSDDRYPVGRTSILWKPSPQATPPIPEEQRTLRNQLGSVAQAMRWLAGGPENIPPMSEPPTRPGNTSIVMG